MSEVTVKILEEIRDEMRTMRGEMRMTRDELSARVDETNSELRELRKRQVESEIRISTELVGVASAVQELRDDLRKHRALTARVDDHERRISSLEKRSPRRT